jgi:hypothetical protein
MLLCYLNMDKKNKLKKYISEALWVLVAIGKLNKVLVELFDEKSIPYKNNWSVTGQLVDGQSVIGSTMFGLDYDISPEGSGRYPDNICPDSYKDKILNSDGEILPEIKNDILKVCDFYDHLLHKLVWYFIAIKSYLKPEDISLLDLSVRNDVEQSIKKMSERFIPYIKNEADYVKSLIKGRTLLGKEAEDYFKEISKMSRTIHTFHGPEDN